MIKLISLKMFNIKRQFKVDGFEWTDGTAVDFTSWQNGEPNNAGGNENCVESSGTGNIKNNLYY